MRSASAAPPSAAAVSRRRPPRRRRAPPRRRPPRRRARCRRRCRAPRRHEHDLAGERHPPTASPSSAGAGGRRLPVHVDRRRPGALLGLARGSRRRSRRAVVAVARVHRHAVALGVVACSAGSPRSRPGSAPGSRARSRRRRARRGEVGVLELDPQPAGSGGQWKVFHGSSISGSIGSPVADLRADAHDLDARDQPALRRSGGSTRRCTGTRGARA